MCGRYRLARKKEILAETFDVDNNDIEWSPRYNVAPGQNVPSSSPRFGSALALDVARALGTDSVLGKGCEGRIQNDQR
jgi:putative SOS response-associated peptidase YedK